jgi:hypothetical protein
MSKTPFNAIYFPENDINETHLELTQTNVDRIWFEISNYHLHPDGDADRDGLTNDAELVFGTDSQNPDTDSDWMDDSWEVEFALDPVSPETAQQERNADPDGDSYSTYAEYCGSVIGDYTDCVFSFRSDPTNERQTPKTMRGALVSQLTFF